MKALLGILVVVVLVAIVGIWSGIIDIDQTREARLPTVEGGQLPAVDVDVPKVSVGTTSRTVEVPTVKTEERQVEVPAITVEKDAE
jgi:hypothetical protein